MYYEGRIQNCLLFKKFVAYTVKACTSYLCTKEVNIQGVPKFLGHRVTTYYRCQNNSIGPNLYTGCCMT